LITARDLNKLVAWQEIEAEIDPALDSETTHPGLRYLCQAALRNSPAAGNQAVHDQTGVPAMLSVITACFNEEANVEELYSRVRAAMAAAECSAYEHIFIDNASTDQTVAVLKRLAETDPNIKIIVNARNFGHIRSPLHALLQAKGDAVIVIVADLQDPPELIPEMIARWRDGFYTVLCIKRSSEEDRLMFWLRKSYYAAVERLSSIATIQNFTGFGLYDRKVIEAVRNFDDPYPYFRGMVAEIGLNMCTIPYDQPVRKRGLSTSNFYVLYDTAMLGIINLSKVPLRLVTALGFFTACLSLLTGLGYLLYKLIFWSHFNVGIAPLVIGLFFLGSVQMLSLGIIGEYVGAIHTQVQKRPHVIEKERVGF
jgi:glycosyltransferase involved in cell wall biosynthesis